VGAFGALALVLVCLLDAALIGALAEGDDAARVGLAAGAAGRAALLLPARVLPPARTDGHLLVGVGIPQVAVALLLAAALALPAGAAGLAGLGAAVLAAAAVGLLAARRFGGVTGDVLGAAAKLGETSALLAAVVVLA
jgi:adenosylcobinamide-GDP ribazoletransferase